MLKGNYLIFFITSLLLLGYSAPDTLAQQPRGLYIWQIDSTWNSQQPEGKEYQRQLEEKLEQSYAEHDTTTSIVSLIELADLSRWKGSFEDAFENLWKAFLLATESKDEALQVRIDRNMGITYEVFNQDSMALELHQKALKDAKRLSHKGILNQTEVLHCYFSLSAYYRNKGEFTLALQYLDSCEQLHTGKGPMPYADADRGYIYLQMNRTAEAHESLRRANKHMISNKQRYQVVTLSFMGDLYAAIHQQDSALYYYQQSLQKMNELNAYINIKSKVLYKIAGILQQKGQLREAYRYMEDAKIATDSLYMSTVLANKKLFENKTNYQSTLLENEQKIKEQASIIAQNKQRVIQLIAGFAFILLAFALMFTAVQYRTRLRKLKTQQELEQSQNNALLELKNKELTGFALKNLEKEKAVLELLEEVKSASPTTYSYLRNKHIHSSNKMWEEFNLKFVELNANFYDQLRQKHPDLTPTEAKHCALIKLNFDSKEMAQILNISVQSVHTSRYRIRKKMGLDTEVNLENYVASFA